MSAEVLVPKLNKTFPTDMFQAAVMYGVRSLGYERPNEDQATAVNEFLKGRSVFISLPTAGEGKSLSRSCSETWQLAELMLTQGLCSFVGYFLKAHHDKTERELLEKLY